MTMRRRSTVPGLPLGALVTIAIACSTPARTISISTSVPGSVSMITRPASPTSDAGGIAVHEIDAEVCRAGSHRRP